jgi:hypothetical protein
MKRCHNTSYDGLIRLGALHSKAMKSAWRLTTSPTSRNSIVDYYDALSTTFDDVYYAKGKFSEAPWNELSMELAEIAGKIAKIQPHTIADIGCGSGHWSRQFVHNCQEVHRLAKSNFESMRLPGTLRYSVGDVLHSPIARLLPSNVDVSILGFVLSHYSETEVERILTNVAERSERILIIDSTSAESTSPRSQFKEHHVNGRWYSVFKRYEPLDHWVSVLSRRRLAPIELAHTKHFFALISSRA